MASGDLAVTCTAYATLALAIAAMDAENLPAATDQIYLLPNYGGQKWNVVKVVRSA